MTAYIDWNTDGDKATARDILRDFSNSYSRWSDDEFQGEEGMPPIDAVEIIAAYYKYEDYSGTAFLVYRDKRDGKLYENNGGHCSCYGLEGQWSPSEASPKEIIARPEYIYEYGQTARTNEAIRSALSAALDIPIDSLNVVLDITDQRLVVDALKHYRAATTYNRQINKDIETLLEKFPAGL